MHNVPCCTNASTTKRVYVLCFDIWQRNSKHCHLSWKVPPVYEDTLGSTVTICKYFTVKGCLPSVNIPVLFTYRVVAVNCCKSPAVWFDSNAHAFVFLQWIIYFPAVICCEWLFGLIAVSIKLFRGAFRQFCKHTVYDISGCKVHLLTHVKFCMLSKTSCASPSFSIDNVIMRKSRHLIKRGWRPVWSDGGRRSTVCRIGYGIYAKCWETINNIAFVAIFLYKVYP